MSLGPSAVSRRAFLATSAAAAAVTGLGRAQTPPAEGRTVGFALVGIGSLTTNQILPAFAKCKYARPVALVSGSPDKANQRAMRFGIDPKNIYNYENFDTIKDNPAVDVVYIVLPNGMHAEYTIRAAKAGKHVLCEKPMANNVEDCQAMIAACNAASRKLMIAYRLRYEPLTKRAIELARSEQSTGKIKLITSEAGFNIGDPTQWRLNRKLAGGGSMMDIGIYALNATRYLSGEEPIEIAAMNYTTPDDQRFKEVEETTTFQLRFPSGAMANCVSTYGFGINRFRVYGMRGQVEMEPFLNYTGDRLYAGRGRGRQEVQIEAADHFASEMDHMAECVLNNQNPLTPGEEGLRDVKYIMAAYESARTGNLVKLT